MHSAARCAIHILCFKGLSLVSGPVMVPSGIPVFFERAMVGVDLGRDDDGSTILVGWL